MLVCRCAWAILYRRNFEVPQKMCFTKVMRLTSLDRVDSNFGHGFGWSVLWQVRVGSPTNVLYHDVSIILLPSTTVNYIPLDIVTWYNDTGRSLKLLLIALALTAT